MLLLQENASRARRLFKKEGKGFAEMVHSGLCYVIFGEEKQTNNHLSGLVLRVARIEPTKHNREHSTSFFQSKSTIFS
jgi:hypothetical protein